MSIELIATLRRWGIPIRLGTDRARPAVRPRPPLIRALGSADPPSEVRVDGQVYRRVEILKHDSWAATAIYGEAADKIICKFNRQQSILGFPMRWLGRRLAAREARMLRRLSHTGHVPAPLGHVMLDGQVLDYAVARRYIAGHPLAENEQVNDRFFPLLQRLLDRMHARGIAYVDLHKGENVLVGEDGRPYLIDFQISIALPRWWPARSRMARAVLRLFQNADDYHLLKHWSFYRPDQCTMTRRELGKRRPWVIRLHRLLAVPFRGLRRRLLVALGIRTRGGRASSEFFAEDAFRRMGCRGRDAQLGPVAARSPEPEDLRKEQLATP